MVSVFQELPKFLQLLLIFLPAISLFIAALALILNWNQSRLNGNLTRAKIISDFIRTFLGDEKMQSAFYKIEYDDFEYSVEFHGSDTEKEVDALLRHFSNIALMWENKILRIKDIRHVEYFLTRVLSNPEIIKYINFLESWSQNAKTGKHPFVNLKKLIKALEN